MFNRHFGRARPIEPIDPEDFIGNGLRFARTCIAAKPADRAGARGTAVYRPCWLVDPAARVHSRRVVERDERGGRGRAASLSRSLRAAASPIGGGKRLHQNIKKGRQIESPNFAWFETVPIYFAEVAKKTTMRPAVVMASQPETRILVQTRSPNYKNAKAWSSIVAIYIVAKVRSTFGGENPIRSR